VKPSELKTAIRSSPSLGICPQTRANAGSKLSVRDVAHLFGKPVLPGVTAAGSPDSAPYPGSRRMLVIDDLLQPGLPHLVDVIRGSESLQGQRAKCLGGQHRLVIGPRAGTGLGERGLLDVVRNTPAAGDTVRDLIAEVFSTYSKNSSGVAMISRMAGCDLFQSRTKFGLSISGMPKSPSEPNSGKAS